MENGAKGQRNFQSVTWQSISRASDAEQAAVQCNHQGQQENRGHYTEQERLMVAYAESDYSHLNKKHEPAFCVIVVIQNCQVNTKYEKKTNTKFEQTTGNYCLCK